MTTNDEITRLLTENEQLRAHVEKARLALTRIGVALVEGRAEQLMMPERFCMGWKALRYIEASISELPAPLARRAVSRAGTCTICGVPITDKPASGFLARCGRRVLTSRREGCPQDGQDGAL